MGLDMYLTKRRREADDEELVAYWRKANQIHGWFERNVAGGYIENCENYPVCLDELNCLVEDCKLVMGERARASSILPCTEGFLFGGQAYDDCYFDNVQETVDMVEKVVREATDGDEFFYRAWW